MQSIKCIMHIFKTAEMKMHIYQIELMAAAGKYIYIFNLKISKPEMELKKMSDAITININYSKQHMITNSSLY